MRQTLTYNGIAIRVESIVLPAVGKEWDGSIRPINHLSYLTVRGTLEPPKDPKGGESVSH